MNSPNHKIPRVAFLLLAATLLLLSTVSAPAQETGARPDRGAMPRAAYSVSDLESVSLTNGNMQVSIPLASLPPMAGGKLGLTLSAVYNSKLWNVTRTEYQSLYPQGCQSWVVSTPQLGEVGGWRIAGGQYQLVFRDAREDFDYVVPPSGPPGSCESDVAEYNRLMYQWKRVVLIGPDGAEHELRPVDNYQPYGPTGGSRPYLFNYYKDTPQTTNSPMRYYSFDGSFLWAVINPASYSTQWTVKESPTPTATA